MESRLVGVESGVVFRSDLFSALFFWVFLFIYVNDLDDGLTCKVLNFEDDTKIASKVITTLDKELLQ